MMTKTGYKTKWNWMLRDKLKKKKINKENDNNITIKRMRTKNKLKK